MNYSWCHDDLACSKQLQLRNRRNLLSTPLIIRPSTGHIFVSRTVDCLSWIHSCLRDSDTYYSWQTFFTNGKHFFLNYTLTFSKVYHFQFRLLLPWIRYSLDQLAGNNLAHPRVSFCRQYVLRIQLQRDEVLGLWKISTFGEDISSGSTAASFLKIEKIPAIEEETGKSREIY